MDVVEVRAMCLWLRKFIPHQQFDDDTPEVWAPTLSRVSRQEAYEAVLAIVERSPYVAPVDIVKEVRVRRRDRLRAAGDEALCPNVDPDDVVAWVAESRALRAAVAGGSMSLEVLAAYHAGEVRPLTGGAPHVVAGSLVSGRLPRLEARCVPDE